MRLNPFKKNITDVKETSPSPTEGVGSPGFANYNGFIQEKEKNSNLTGTQKYIVYSNNLSNVAVVGAGVRYFLNLLAKASWNVDAADESPAAQEAAKFVKNVIGNTRTPWSRIIRRAGMYKFYGFNIQEWTAVRREDGMIGLLDIVPRPQFTIERWDTDEQGTVRGVVQRSPQDQKETYIPIEKLVYAVDDSLTDSPEGIGIFRHLVDPIDRLKRYEQLEGFGFETDLRGIPVAKAPLSELQQLVRNGEITKEQRDSILKPVRNFVQNHVKSPKLGMLIDSSTYRSRGGDQSPTNIPQWNIDLLKAGNTSQAEIAKAIERITHEIARLIGVEHLLLGGDGRGTQALSRDKSHNFYLIIDSTLTELEQTFNRDIIDRLWDLNGLDPAIKPQFSTEAVQFRDIEQITSALADLAKAGAPLDPNDPAINEIRDLLGLSRIEMDELLGEMTRDAALRSGGENGDELPDDEENEEE